MVAVALGGKVDQLSKKYFIGKTVVSFTPISLRLSYINKTIKDYTH